MNIIRIKCEVKINAKYAVASWTTVLMTPVNFRFLTGAGGKDL